MNTRATVVLTIGRLFCALALAISGLTPAVAQAQTPVDTVQRWRDTGVIRLAHRDGSIPFSYLDDSGRPAGFSVDLCIRLVQHLRTQFKLPDARIQWIQVNSAERMQVVKDGKADIECGSTTNNAERRQQYAFTMPTFVAGIKIMSAPGKNYNAVHELMGKRAAANAGTTASKLIVTSNQDKLASVIVVETKDHNEAWDLLRTGKVDAWLTDDVLLAGYRARSDKPETFAISRRFLTIEPYGMVLRHEDKPLVALMNLEITRMMRSGDFKKLYETWFERPIFVPGRVVNLKLPMSEMLRAQLQSPAEILPGTF